VMKVAGTSRPAELAKTIAHRLAEEGPVVLSGMGPRAVNQAVKGIAISREHIGDEGSSVACSPKFVTLTIDGEERSGVRMELKVKATPAGESDSSELRVASGSDVRRLAGAIANRMREGGPVSMTAIGPFAVNQAVKAIIIADRYLEDDKIDLAFVPSFSEFESDGETRSAVSFVIDIA